MSKRRHNFINAWKPSAKQRDKVNIEIRFGKLTIFELGFDVSRGSFRLMVMNFGYEATN